MRLATLALGFLLGAIVFVGASLVLAWTGPTSAPPNGNVSAPINVGTIDQIKNAGLGINALAVFGNSILQAASYLNWGSTSGSNGYGIRDNNGTMEFKNSAGTWQGLLGTSSTFTQIRFSDGTTQTTAATTSVPAIVVRSSGNVRGGAWATATAYCQAGEIVVSAAGGCGQGVLGSLGVSTNNNSATASCYSSSGNANGSASAVCMHVQ